MGVGEKCCNKQQIMDGIVESSSEGKRWIIALRRPMKPILTKATWEKKNDDDEEEYCSTTPTSEESTFTCPPPAPKKRKSSSRCHHFKEFFNPPDLDSVFIRRVET
ncbi:cyclin-dependent protein kinase inhibitor SMR8-like [Solanum dulcamara]|uniref:cyclin-dependent protein kinase inhibitor SMR8-like n=1 Tax=Solanum dulcamara TaxID=45834 RepID=UPI0024852208|nr:cyclin-dependent protein kinase inhibitor SMR8-like [Solanum dulcamara]